MKKLVGFALLIVMLAAAQCSGGNAAPKITVEDAWARPSAMMAGSGAVYVTLKNTGGDDVAEAVELHQTKMEGDMMKMSPVPNIPVPAGETVKLEPGGKHIMLINLKQTLNPGEKISVTLNFEKSGAMTLDVPVKAPN